MGAKRAECATRSAPPSGRPLAGLPALPQCSPAGLTSFRETVGFRGNELREGKSVSCLPMLGTLSDSLAAASANKDGACELASELRWSCWSCGDSSSSMLLTCGSMDTLMSVLLEADNRLPDARVAMAMPVASQLWALPPLESNSGSPPSDRELAAEPCIPTHPSLEDQETKKAADHAWNSCMPAWCLPSMQSGHESGAAHFFSRIMWQAMALQSSGKRVAISRWICTYDEQHQQRKH